MIKYSNTNETIENYSTITIDIFTIWYYLLTNINLTRSLAGHYSYAALSPLALAKSRRSSL